MIKNKGITAIIISMIIFAGMALYGMFFLPGDDALGFGLLFLYIIFPLTCLISGFFVGKHLEKVKYFYPIITSAAFVIVTTLVFNFDINTTILFLAFLPALIGVLIGYKTKAHI